MTLWPLVAATYFMVSGGPYGLEELVQKAGYDRALLLILLTPLLWSLPTAIMVGELAAALPETGGYYAWVRRALGPFWGFQEAWLSLAASFFDMAIYPTLFTLYLGRIWPPASSGLTQIAIGAAMIAGCAVWNLRGARAVGGASLLLSLILLAPFLALLLGSVAQPAVAAPPPSSSTLLGGLIIAMWNFMGWDNASTVASEVKRPQRTYPRAMLVTVALVALSYALPIWACRHAGIDPSRWTTGAWVDAGTSIGGKALGLAMVVGGVACGVGMFNALVLSYSRVPLAMAQDGLLPKLFARTDPHTGAPIWAVVGCAVAYTACLGLGFDRLVLLDVVLYGLALSLEFVALVALRLKEPRLPRPFRVPGGLVGAVLIAVAPLGLLGLALRAAFSEASWASIALAGGLVALGPLLYLVVRRGHVAVDSTTP